MSFHLVVDSSKFKRLCVLVCFQFNGNPGLAKITVSSGGFHLMVSPLFDTLPSVDVSLLIKPAGFVDFGVAPGSSGFGYTIKIDDFNLILSMCPDGISLSLDKEPDRDVIVFNVAGVESYDLEILPPRLPRFPDCHFVNGTLTTLCNEDLRNLVLGSRVLVHERLGCILYPPRDYYGFGFCFETPPVFLPFVYAFDIFSDCPRDLLWILAEIRFESLTVAVLESSWLNTILIQCYYGNDAEEAVFRLLLQARIYYPGSQPWLASFPGSQPS